MSTDSTTDPATDAHLRAFGSKFKRYRTELGLSQAEVASRLVKLGLSGAHQMLISRVEAGKRDVTVSEALRLASALEIPLTTLFATDEMPAEVAHLTKTARETADALERLRTEAWPTFAHLRARLVDQVLKSSIMGNTEALDPSTKKWVIQITYMALQVEDPSSRIDDFKPLSVEEMLDAIPARALEVGVLYYADEEPDGKHPEAP